MDTVEVRFFAAARAAAKAEQIQVPAGTLNQILANLKRSEDLARVIPQCSFLVNAVICHDYEAMITAGSQIDVLPKFAGG
jgi:sulfur-carrier protein